MFIRMLKCLEMRFLIFFAVLALWSSDSSAACTAITTEAPFPATLGPGACYEIRGNVRFSGTRTLASKLTVRTDSRAELAEGTRIILAPGGELVVRGELYAENDTSFELSSGSRIANNGVLILNGGSRIEAGEGAVIKNIGQFFLFPRSELILAPGSSFATSGLLEADAAKLEGSSMKFENAGTIDLRAGSLMDFSGTSRVLSRAKFITRGGSVLNFRESSIFTNKRSLNFAGSVLFSDKAWLQNHGIADFEGPGKLRVNGSGVIENHHIIDLYGQMVLSGQALFKNLRNFQIRAGAVLEIAEGAALINESTVTDNGTILAKSREALVNHYIFYVRGQKSTDNLYELLKIPESPAAMPQTEMQSGAVAPAAGQPGVVAPAAGQPGAVAPAAGQSVAVAPATGQAEAGVPAAGQAGTVPPA